MPGGTYALLSLVMILGFRDKRTKMFAEGRFVREFNGFARQAYKRLEVLDAATSITDLAALSSNGLEVLKGGQWRVCFEWPDGAKGPSNVEIVDYH